jgi:hypothetical protein
MIMVMVMVVIVVVIAAFERLERLGELFAGHGLVGHLAPAITCSITFCSKIGPRSSIMAFGVFL